MHAIPGLHAIYVYAGRKECVVIIIMPYHMTNKMADRASLAMLFRICWQLAALLWLQPDGAVAVSTGKSNAS